MNTTENNKIIAEFMGWEIINNQSNIWVDCKPNKEQEPLQLLNFLFDSWDVLMEVVDKIESLGYTVTFYKTVNTGISYCEVNLPTQNGETCKAFKHSRESKMQAVYLGVIEFLKFYNQQK